MICGLFSVFDPVCSFPLIGLVWVNWIFVLPLFISFFWQFGPISSGVEIVNKQFCNFIVLGTSSFPELNNSSVVFSSLFCALIVVNLSGLSPLCWSISSHPGIIFPISITLFFAWVYKSLIIEGYEFLSHFLPSGSPVILWVFLVCVETISIIIRPFTLAIRLVANVMAGHLFVEILSSLSSIPLLYPIMSGLLGFEVMVGVIQAFVFTNLLMLYWSE